MTMIWAFVLLSLASACEGMGRREVYEGHQLLRIKPATAKELEYVHQLTNLDTKLDFWTEARRLGQETVVMVPPTSMDFMKKYLKEGNVKVNTEHTNMESVVSADYKIVEDTRNKMSSSAVDFDYSVYHTYEEIMQEMEELKARCPTGLLCQTYSIGLSYEGREQRILRVYKNGPNRKVYWYDSLIHAREWITGATLLKIVDHIFTNYDTNQQAKAFLDRGDYYFLFVHNPDGYSYTWTDERLWRKNRFNSSSIRETSCYGIDLNRNYMHRWGNAGNNDDPCSNNYRGIRPASEVEVKNIQDEVLRIAAQQQIESFVTLHAQGRLVLLPWGSVIDPGTEEICEFLPEAEHKEVEKVAKAMADAMTAVHNHDEAWIGGNSCADIYPASGVTMDFARGVAGVMFSYTFELRGSDADNVFYGHEAPPSEIQPSFEEVWRGLNVMYEGIDDYKKRMAPTCTSINTAGKTQSHSYMNYFTDWLY